jgi:hypothetical protein
MPKVEQNCADAYRGMTHPVEEALAETRLSRGTLCARVPAMRMTTTRIAPLLAALALTAAACTGNRKTETNHSAVPPAVVAAEGLAEDMQADLDTLGWGAAGAKLARLRDESTAMRMAGYETTLDSLAAGITRRDRLAALQAANRASRLLLAVAATYKVTVPVNVGLLDVAGRDAIYRSEAGRWQDASAAVAELRANYDAIQGHVASSDAALDQRLAQQLQALHAAVSARNAGRVRNIATRFLDDVDLVERTY